MPFIPELFSAPGLARIDGAGGRESALHDEIAQAGQPVGPARRKEPAR